MTVRRFLLRRAANEPLRAQAHRWDAGALTRVAPINNRANTKRDTQCVQRAVFKRKRPPLKREVGADLIARAQPSGRAMRVGREIVVRRQQ